MMLDGENQNKLLEGALNYMHISPEEFIKYEQAIISDQDF